MAYSDYGSFVYVNGVRRTDKEDVGVFDTDEAVIPEGSTMDMGIPGLRLKTRVIANILKAQETGNNAWHDHSHHGVLGDGVVRVGLYKQGLPSSGIYYWPEDADEPQRFNIKELLFPDLPRHPGTDAPQNEVNAYYEKVNFADYDYGNKEETLVLGGQMYLFRFTDKESSSSGHYEALMRTPDETTWKCIYDYGYGAGLSDPDEGYTC